MTDDSGYPYDTLSSAFEPSAVAADSSFVITAKSQGKGMNPKIWFVIVFVLFLLLSFVVTTIVIQRRQSLADIRNYAENEEEQGGPQQGFGGLVTTPAHIAQNQPPSCLPGDTSPRCQTTRTTITAQRVTPTPTPSPTPRQNIISTLFSLFVSPTPTPLATPLSVQPTLTPTSIQSGPTSTGAPTATLTVTPIPTAIATTAAPAATATPAITSTPVITSTPATTTAPATTATPIPVLSCQRVELFKGTENVTQDISRITYGDTVRFVGYVSDVGRAVQSIRFRLMINNQVVEEKDAPAALSGNTWVAQYEHTFSVYGSHRVTVPVIIPKS